MLKRLVFFLLLSCLLTGISSAQIKVETEAPDFNLFGVDYKYHRLSEYLAKEETKAVVVIIRCNHCPVVVRYEDKMVEIATKYQPKGFPFIAVNANPADMVPADGFPQMIERAKEKSLPFPYVYDETQGTSRAYGATRTPEIFVIGKGKKVLYTGAIDNQGNEPFYLTDALEDILAGREIKNPSSKPFGCTIKYRK